MIAVHSETLFRKDSAQAVQTSQPGAPDRILRAAEHFTQLRVWRFLLGKEKKFQQGAAAFRKFFHRFMQYFSSPGRQIDVHCVRAGIFYQACVLTRLHGLQLNPFSQGAALPDGNGKNPISQAGGVSQRREVFESFKTNRLKNVMTVFAFEAEPNGYGIDQSLVPFE
jgi:hypothetical protein